MKKQKVIMFIGDYALKMSNPDGSKLETISHVSKLKQIVRLEDCCMAEALILVL
jgi:hypothetical protein